MTPPDHILDLVTHHLDKWVVSGAPYPVIMVPSTETHPQLLFTCYKLGETGGLHPSRIPHEGIDYVDGLATGCLFIKRDVFKMLEKPYFEFKFEHETRKVLEGEDLGFCFKMVKAGIKFFVDYGMVCGHQKEVNLLEMNNYAILYAKKAVENYAAMIKPILDQLSQRARKAKGETASGLIIPSMKL